MKTSLLLCLLTLLSSCVADSPGTDVVDAPKSVSSPTVNHWGEMRVVLREGRTEGRVALSEVIGANTIALGAMEALTGEITVLDGVTHVTEVDRSTTTGVVTRGVAHGDRATLLVAAQVDEWSQHELGAVPDLATLEERIRSLAGTIASAPMPFRVEGTAARLGLHVLDGSCPIANPDGPSPWRYVGEEEPTTLVGFYAENSAGVLTHHGQATHIHAILAQREISGHLDDVSFLEGARLYLPAR